MTKLVVLPLDDATDALRAGARHAVRDALAAELEAVAELRPMLETASNFKPWLTTEETARFIGCDAATAEGRAKAVRKLHEAGLPYVMLGRQRLTSRDELTAWLQDQPRGSASAACSTAVPERSTPPEIDSFGGDGTASGVLMLDGLPWPDSLMSLVNSLLPPSLHRSV